MTDCEGSSALLQGRRCRDKPQRDTGQGQAEQDFERRAGLHQAEQRRIGAGHPENQDRHHQRHHDDRNQKTAAPQADCQRRPCRPDGGQGGRADQKTRAHQAAGAGIIALGRLSQRPIIPLTVISSRVQVFDSWDKATMGLPFGHLVITMGEPMLIDPDADKAALEEYRKNLQSALDHLHHRAYAMVGAQDPGMDLRKPPVSASASEAS